MDNCIFCKLISGQIPCVVVYEDDWAFAFRDIAPQAPSHVIVVPKRHLANVLEAEEAGEELARVMQAAARVARMEGLEASGFRMVTNCGAHGCQSEFHFHVHVLGGRQLAPELG